MRAPSPVLRAAAHGVPPSRPTSLAQFDWAFGLAFESLYSYGTGRAYLRGCGLAATLRAASTAHAQNPCASEHVCVDDRRMCPCTRNDVGLRKRP